MSKITWNAIYKDGTNLPQYNVDGAVNKYPDIDRSKLEFFELNQGEKLLFKLHLEAGRKLIVRRRTMQSLLGTNKKVVWMVGWQWNANGRNVQDIAWVFEDGHVELTGQFKEMPYAAPGKLMACEEEVG